MMSLLTFPAHSSVVVTCELSPQSHSAHHAPRSAAAYEWCPAPSAQKRERIERGREEERVRKKERERERERGGGEREREGERESVYTCVSV